MSRPLVIIGDSLLDIDLVGQVSRLAPDAPVPVVSQPVEHRRPGGAALCAALAAERLAGSSPVVLITAMADDADGQVLRSLLPGAVELITITTSGTTPVKSRIRAGQHAVARVDRGGLPGALGELPPVAGEVVAQAGAVLVADYGNGVTHHPALRRLIRDAAARVPVVWDPHPRGANPVEGVTLVTPNREEARRSTFIAGDDLRATHLRSAQLRERWSAHAVAITLGAEGALLNIGTSVPLLVPAPIAASGDECGAGDCFAVNTALALAGGALPTEAVTVAVAAAAEFVAAGGAALAGRRWAQTAKPTTDRQGPVDASTGTPSSAIALAESVWAAGGTVVGTGGCFDLLHAGHVATLEAARRLGDCLIVCLNSDASIRRLKGAPRPLQNADDRARILRALRCVDAVVEFDEDTPAELLERLRPNVWVKGGDYTASTLPEADVLARWGGQVVAVPYLPERSTTALVTSARRPDGARGGH